MDALVKLTTLRELAKHGCQLDGPNGEPLTDDDVYGVRLVRIQDADVPHENDIIRAFRYDLQTADASGKWHSVSLDELWIPTLKSMMENPRNEIK